MKKETRKQKEGNGKGRRRKKEVKREDIVKIRGRKISGEGRDKKKISKEEK